MRDLYSDFVDSTYTLAHNVVCASCGVIGHDPSLYYMHRTDDVSLRILSIPQEIYIPFDFSIGYTELDNDCVMIEKLGISQNGNVNLCESCHRSIVVSRRPIEAFSNYRWIGEQPEELADLTWLEELLITRAHLVGRIIRLEERKASSYFALKGHTILLPQDTTRLLDLLPMPLSSLPDIVRVYGQERLLRSKVDYAHILSSVQ